MPIRALKYASCVVGLLFLAGCATPTAGTAQPAPDASGTTSTTTEEPSSGEDELPSDGAPRVADPLDIGRFSEDPCLALTAAQTEQLGLPPTGELKDGALGKACTWSRQQSAAVDVNMFTRNPEGLSAIYRAHEAGRYTFFEPLPPIEGYPAVIYDITDARDLGKCVVAVGTADDLAFDVSIQLASADVGTKDPCEAVVATATLMVRTMKAG